MGRVVVSLACLVAAAVALAQGTTEPSKLHQADDEIGLSFAPVWGDIQAFGDFQPVRVEIENPLNNDRGVLILKRGVYELKIPVELPSRTIRSFIVYVPTEGYDEPVLRLECQQATLSVRLPYSSPDYGGSVNVGLVSDTTSLLAFLRRSSLKKESDPDGYAEVVEPFKDFACLPGQAPDRTIGYQGLDLLVLGEGSERMTDPEVAAAQHYVLSGGRVLFTGGAVSPVLRDPRWARFIPGTDPQVVNLKSGAVIRKLLGKGVSELTLTKLVPSSGANALSENGVPITITKACGMGESIYWAFDPFQGPVRNVAGREQLFLKEIETNRDERRMFLSTNGLTGNSYEQSYYGSYSPGPTTSQTTSEFKVSAPRSETMFLILTIYLLTVVPVNFFVLAKLKKGHLAWVTAPVIGLVFASVFFVISRDLYGRELSRATTAVVFAHQGDPRAYAFGRQQIFFPAGGRYDLRLQDIEAISSAALEDFSPFGRSVDTGFSGDLIDVGEIIAPAAGVSNLTFRDVEFRQNVTFPHNLPLELDVTLEKNSVRAKGTLYNDTPFVIRSCVLFIGKGRATLAEVQPGKTISINTLLDLSGRRLETEPAVPVPFKGVLMFAHIEGLNVGAQIGKESKPQRMLVFSYDGVSGVPKNN